jgi:hypothetical protein
VKQLAVTAVVCLLLAACDRGAEAPSALPRWTAQEDLRIGQSADPQQNFEAVGDITVSPGGIIYAVIPGESRVRVYDASGRLVQLIGKNGPAPGEFLLPYRVGSAGNQLWVFDIISQKVTLFQPTGAFSILLEPFARVPRELPDTLIAFQTLLADGSTLARIRPAAEPLPGVQISVPLVRIQQTGVVDTIARVTEVSSMLLAKDPRRPGDPGIIAAQPFAGVTPVAVSTADRMIVVADPIFASTGPRYRLSKLNLVGDTVFTSLETPTRKPIPNRVVNAKVNEIARSMMNAQSGRAPTLDVQQEWVRRALYLPEFAPAITGLIVGTDGAIYVRHADIEERVDWTVFSPLGEQLAQFTTPANLRFTAADAAHLYGTTGEREPPVIVRYRLRRS